MTTANPSTGERDLASPSLFDTKLDELRKSGEVASLYLHSGIRITGTVKNFDAYSVLVQPAEDSGHEEIVLQRHWLSSVARRGVAESNRQHRRAPQAAAR